MTTAPSAAARPHAGALQDPARRRFLVRAAAGGGFMIGCSLPGVGLIADASAQSIPQYNVTAWIVIGTDGTVTIQVPVSESGQGSMTGLAQIVADELRLDWSRIAVVHAPVDAAHGGRNAGPWGRFTGGSLGIRLFSPVMQQAAANAREMLILAARQYWSGASVTNVQADRGYIKATVNGAPQSVTYGALASIAAGVSLSGNAPLNKYPRTFVGTPAPRVDIPAKVYGTAKFGIDVFLPGMVFAAVKHAPAVGGTVGSLGSKPSGALAVVPVGGIGTPGAAGYRPHNGVAVVAATTWDAMRAARSMSVSWNEPADAASNDTAAINARAAALMSGGTPIVAQEVNSGALTAALAAPGAINATYQLPFVAHACMEPMNCTVRFTPSSGTTPARCEVWAPTQAPDGVLQTVTAMCPAGTAVTVVNTLMGGAFGRKFEQDCVREAVQVALAYPGVPVKLTWPREQDFGYDMFRPMALSRIQAAADANGRITGWRNRIVTPSISVQRGGNPAALDGSAVDGAVRLPYALNPLLVEYVRHDTTIPVGYWRSVGMSINTFAVECAMDELAASIGMDPIQFRLNNLSDARMRNVLQTLQSFSNWGVAPAAGRARGVAIGVGFGSYMGQVAEISVDSGSGGVRVHRVSMVVDCGVAINPDEIAAQMEGAIAQGIAVTLWDQQTFASGVPQVTNFNRYRLLRLKEMPQVDVKIIANGDPMGGIGETGMPCIAPAIANAYAKLVGAAARKRVLPFFPGMTMGGL